jgi:hypothetical protein
LSREYPIAAIVCEEHVLAFAERLNGDATTAPFAGAATVTAAAAGMASVASNKKREVRFLTVVI